VAALAGIGLWCRNLALSLERPTEHLFFSIGDQKTDDTITTDKATPLLLCFFSAAIVVMALSGGLYLIGIKGTIDQTRIGIAGSGEQLLAEPSIEAVQAALTEVGVTDFEFDYVKQKGSQLITRPTTRPFYTLDVSGNEVVVQYNEPSLQKKMIELHMGHGPVAYKTYQNIFPAGMLFIILSGLWAGLSSTKLRGPTAAVAGGGLLVFALLAMS
jgi:hypothetical protein